MSFALFLRGRLFNANALVIWPALFCQDAIKRLELLFIFGWDEVYRELLARWMHKRERLFAQRDTNRLVRPFEWGREFVEQVSITTDDRLFFRRHTHAVMQNSDKYYELPLVEDYHRAGDLVTWSSSTETPTPNNNIVRAHYFPVEFKKNQKRKAVLILPHWNAPPQSYFDLARLFNRLGYSALRLTLPYHEERNDPTCERSDFIISSNIGRTLQSMRQAVLDARAAIHWLKQTQRYERIGLVGTSIGSCTGFLAFAHDPVFDVFQLFLILIDCSTCPVMWSGKDIWQFYISKLPLETLAGLAIFSGVFYYIFI